MSRIKVYHGSDHIIQLPRYLGGRSDNDYGNGFYTTEYEDRARSWATLNGKPEKAVVNIYELDMENLNVLDLNEHGVLAWIAEVIANRGTNQEAAEIIGNRLVELYRIDAREYDVIKGYRADDSYTQVIEAFLLNQINVAEVKRLFYKGSLGNQIFLQSERAFANIFWQSSYEVQLEQRDREDDIRARREVSKFLQTRMKAILLDGYQVNGITAQYAVKNTLIYQKEGDYYDTSRL